MPEQVKEGRPSKLTPKTREKFLLAIRTGATIEVAANTAGIRPSTVYEWMRRGQGTDSRPTAPEFAEFADEVQKAIADSEMILLTRWNQATRTDWKAARDLLARRFPERYALTQKVSLEVDRKLEAQFDNYFELVMGDQSIPVEVKERLLDHAETLQKRHDVASEN